MRTGLRWLFALAALMSGWAVQAAGARDSSGNAEDEAALMKNAQAFVEAFHQGDAQALAAFWATEGDYMDETGLHQKGRPAIEKAFREAFAEHPGLKLRIDIAALRFLTPELAIEDGTTEAIPPDGSPPHRARYMIVHVKKDGQWYLGSVREALFTPPSNYQHLHAMEWLVGEWVDETDNGQAARIAFEWAENRNFLVSSYGTSFKDLTLSSGQQWVVWDPAAKAIRSWTFDSDGSFGEGAWALDGDRLIIKARSTLRDGKTVTATNIITRMGPDTVAWQSQQRTLDGKPLPDVKEIKMKRQN
jgi:uncharacterized protein (TIGR02246 family)